MERIFYCSEYGYYHFISWTQRREFRNSYASSTAYVLNWITTYILNRITMKNKLFIWIVTLFLSLILQSCEDFVDIDSPNFQMVTEDVYSNEKTTIAAIK